jgi:hypothetical protein
MLLTIPTVLRRAGSYTSPIQSKMLLLFACSLFPASLVSKERAWHLDRRSEQRQNFTHRILIVNEEKMRPSESKNVIFIHAWMLKMPAESPVTSQLVQSRELTVVAVQTVPVQAAAGEIDLARWFSLCYISIS